MRRADTALSQLTGAAAPDASRFWVPGRVELLGKHTDYAGGRSLLCATELGICLAAVPRRDTRIRVRDAISGETVDGSATEGGAMPEGHWSGYVRAVARRVLANFPGAIVGADIALASDLPRAAGMSSSSALVVALFLALARVNDLRADPAYRAAIHDCEDLAGYLGTVENGQSFGALVGERGVGTFGGSEDHTAILCARAGMVAQYAFCPVRLEQRAPLPAGYVLVIMASGIVAEKTGAARERYNRLSTTAAEILARWNAVTGARHTTLAGAIAASPGVADRMREMLGGSSAERMRAGGHAARLDQFLVESEELVPAAMAALAAGDIDAFGAVVDRSQDAAEHLLGNQVPETVFLARSARELGAAAASAFGAGFGGSVWALVREGDADAFSARWAERYAGAFRTAAAGAQIAVTRAGPGAMELA